MIAFTSFLISLLGIVLSLILFGAVRQNHALLKLKKYRIQQEGFADHLNYAAVVEDGIIVGKNGSFMAAWLYEGADNASATSEERELTSLRINQAFAKLSSGWMIHVDAVRMPAPNYSEKNKSHFPDKISLAIDEERRQLFESLGTLYRGFFVITITWFPPLLAQRKFIELMFDDDGIKSTKNSQSRDLINIFNRECQNIESRLSTAVQLERISSEKIQQENGSVITQDNFLRWLHFCITGLNHPITLPNNPVYIDNLIGAQEFWPGAISKLGTKFIQCVAIEGFPTQGHPGILTALGELPVESRWSTRFIFMDQHEAIAALEKYQKKWKQKVRGFIDQILNRQGNIDEDALCMTMDASNAIAETNSGMVVQGYYTSLVVLMDENREKLEITARYIEKTINGLGFAARIETVNTPEAFLGSLPGHGVQNVRRPLINSMNMADLLPISTLWTGEKYAPSPLFQPLSPALMHCVTNGNTPFYLNLHVRDLGHCLVVGPTRAGKSTLLGMLALQWRRYFGARIYAFDKGMSMYATCKAVGGKHYNIGAKNDKLAFAPLQFLDTPARRSWAMEWIDNILTLNGLNTTALQRNEIAHAIINMNNSKSRTMSEFVLTIQDEEIRQALKQYTIDGLMGHLIDAEEDSHGISDFITYELNVLMDLGEKFLLPILLYIFRRIEESLDGRPTIIIIDEAWVVLKHPIFKRKIAVWMDTLAKLNCVLVLATQRISHLADSGIIDTVSESTPSKIFLPNHLAKDAETAELYQRLGCNRRQIDIITMAVPKKEYYYKSIKGSRLFDLALGPLALSIVGATDVDSIEHIQELEEKYGDMWIDEWLEFKGIEIEKYGVAA